MEKVIRGWRAPSLFLWSQWDSRNTPTCALIHSYNMLEVRKNPEVATKNVFDDFFGNCLVAKPGYLEAMAMSPTHSSSSVTFTNNYGAAASLNPGFV